MDKEEISQLIENYGNASKILRDALSAFPQEMWKWKPAADKWSVHEIIIHLADSEANSYIRARRFLAEPGSGVYGYDENKWARLLNYHDQNTDQAISLFEMLRNCTYQLIRNVPLETWKSATVIHSENGKMFFYEWLKVYADHVPIHVKQMERNLMAWEKQNNL